MGTYNCTHWDHLNLFYTGDIIFAMGSESELKLAKIKKLSSQNHFKIRSHYCLLPRLVKTRTFVRFQIKPNSDTLTKFLLHTLYSLSNQECWLDQCSIACSHSFLSASHCYYSLFCQTCIIIFFSLWRIPGYKETLLICCGKEGSASSQL